MSRGISNTLILLLSGVLFWAPGSLLAGSIYSYVDRHGVTHFTNCPSDFPDNMATYHDTGMIHSPVIKKAAMNYGLDPALVRAIIQAESGGNPHAVSSKGALGLMQLMPNTARELDVKNPLDPASNIRGGVKYLRSMIDRFGGDLLLALAAYNAGPGTIERYNGLPPYPETVQYVKKVLIYWRNYKKSLPPHPH